MDHTPADILILPSADSEHPGGAKALFGSQPPPLRFAPDELKNKLSTFITTMSSAIANLPQFAAPYDLEEIELKVEINAEGNIQLIGGVKAGATGGITLTLRRQGK